jgi:hypothetical protein
MTRPIPQTIDRIVYVGNQIQQPFAVVSSIELPEASYLRLQRKALAGGLRALPDIQPRASHTAPEHLTLDELLENSARGT